MPVRSISPLQKATLTALAIPALVVFAFLLRLPLSWTDQAVFAGLTVAASIILGHFSRSRLTTLTLTFVSVFCTLRYGIWRWTSTLAYLHNSGWHVEWIGLVSALLLLLAEAYAITIMLLGYFQSASPLKRAPVPLPDNTDLWPSIDVFIPTYSESLEVVRPTVLAAMDIDWPADRLNVYILDDGKRSAFRELAEECGAGYIARAEHKHAKAGNINHALKHTTGEYIAIFDCDHIPTRSFLQVTMGWFFKDQRLAVVQTPHHFYSPDPFERNLNVFKRIPNEGALFYGVVQDGNDLWNATFFCGSCAVIRREALLEVGGIAVETVTEDAHTALRLQRRGWNTAYLGIPQAAGLATGSLRAHVGQRIRWARGMAQILRTECPLFASGLSWPQRLCYFNCVMHYFYAVQRLIFISAPLVYLVFGQSNLYGYIWEIIAYAAPHLVLSNLVNSRSQGNHRHSFWNEVYEMVLAPYILLPTMLALINPKWGKFNVTAKDSIIEESFFDLKIARPYIILLALNVIGLAMMIPRYWTGAESFGVLLVNGFWAFINVMVLGTCIAVSFERKQRRANVRIEIPLASSLIISPDEVHHCSLIDLSESGLALKAERDLHITEGQQLTTILRSGDEEHEFRTEAVRISGNRVHMRFLQTDLKHQKALTKLVYARADSWLDWTKDQSRDRVLRSLITILGIGANGLWMLPSLLIKRERSSKTNKKVATAAVRSASLPAILFLFLLLGHSLFAANTKSVQPETKTFDESQTLAELNQHDPLTLQDAQARASLNVALPGSKVVNKAKLVLHYQARNISPSRIVTLSVHLNNEEVASIPIAERDSNNSVREVPLPSDLLVQENLFTFALQHACTKPCSSPNSSPAWLRIEPSSELHTSGIVVPMPNRLSMLPAPFFDPASNHAVEISFVFAATPDSETLKSAGLVASWFGALATFRSTHFPVSAATLPKGNAVVFAPAGSEMALRLASADNPSSVSVRDNPEDPSGKLLLFIASTPSDFTMLARAVVHMDVDRSTDRVDLSDLDPTISRRGSNSSIPDAQEADDSIAIASSLSDSLLKVKPESPAQLYFHLPADLDFGTRISVPLRLRFQLSGLIGSEKADVTLSLNGVQIAQRRLTTVDGEDSNEQSFAVPTSLLYPSNTLTVALSSSSSNNLQADLSSIDLRIERTTRLEIGSATHYVRMPRLDLFASAGYPFTANRDLKRTAILLPAIPTMPQIGQYLDTVAFLSAQTTFALSDQNLYLGVQGREWRRYPNLIVVGSSSDTELFEPFASQLVLQPRGGHFGSGGFSPSWDEWSSRNFLHRNSESSKLIAALNGDRPANLLMEEFGNPFTANGTVLLLATKSEADTHPYFSQLSNEAKRGKIQGGLLLADESGFHSFAVDARSFTLGQAHVWTICYSWILFHLYLVPVLILTLAYVLARWWNAYLLLQAEQRLAIGMSI